MYTTTNYKTKKALKEAVASDEKVSYYQPGPFGGNEPKMATSALKVPTIRNRINGMLNASPRMGLLCLSNKTQPVEAKTMISLDVLIKLNNNKPVIRDNFNRDSSAVKSSKGYVIHSGVHRSTAFISRVEHPEGWEAFTYWRDYGQAAINGFIEATIEGVDLDGCQLNALSRLYPDWSFRTTKGAGKLTGSLVTAVRTSKGFEERIGGANWRDLHARLHVLRNRRAI